MLSAFKKRHSPRKRYLVGVSGGRDSVVLVDLLAKAGYRNLVLCHLNHGLRGRASGQDAVFVRRMGKKLGLPVEAAKADVRALAKREKISVEAAARAARLRFFAEAGSKHRCARVMLAHHADDQVETVIMRFFRGAGPEGMEGMREISEVRVEGRRMELMRPLLGCWREQIDEYAEEHALEFREDLSNAERAFLRNRVRHDLIPELERIFGRDIRKAVWRLSELAGGENAYFREILGRLDGSGPELPAGRLRDEPVAVQRRWIRAWLREEGIRDVSFRDVEAVRALADPASGKAKVNLPGGRHARRRAKKLFLE